MRLFHVFTIVSTLASIPHRADADVTANAAAGFISEHTLIISAPRTQVFRALTDQVSRWWDPQHSYSGDAANFSIDARPGGCFCERLTDGGVMHMTVVFAQRDTTLRMLGGLGPLQEMAVTGSMTFSLSDADAGTTRLNYRYAVGGYSPEGLQELAIPVDQVQLGQLQRLKRFIETGNPNVGESR
ncbi:MAG: SRPBCC domain-containing protein [Proteobacteria bacterium]|jgi:uncharacterized protein YndB with AHSA1/START domain|nr:SRPBCC domain-containing protein [Pseudomonadota bacterium]